MSETKQSIYAQICERMNQKTGGFIDEIFTDL